MDAKATLIPGTDGTSETGAASALDSASQALFERHKPETFNAASALPGVGDSATQALALDPASALAARQVVRKAIMGGLRTMDKAIQQRLLNACKRIACSDAFQSRLLSQAQLPDEAAEEIAELICVLCDKYGINLRFAPEIALALALGGYGIGVIYAVSELNKMEANAKAAPTN